MRPRRLFIGVSALLLLAAPGLPAGPEAPQQPQPSDQAVFRTGTAVVPVDVRVLDRLGKPVTDLGANDFLVFENGVRQRLTHFAVQALTPQTPEPGAQALKPVARVTDLSPQPRRVILIVLGRGRLQPPSKGVDGLLHFVRERLLPQDLVSVLAWDRATEFTTDHVAIADLLERFKATHERIENKLKQRLTGLAAIYGGVEMPAELRGDIDKVFNGPRAPAVRTPVPPAIATAGRITTDTRETTDLLSGAMSPQLTRGFAGGTASDTAAQQERMSQVIGMALDEFVSTNAQSMQDVGNLYTGVRYLQYMDGEKHLLFAAERTPLLPRADDDKDLATFASDARVAIHYLHTGGTPSALSAAGRGGRGVGRGIASGMDASRPATGGPTTGFAVGQLLPATFSGGTFDLARTVATQTGGMFFGNRNYKTAVDLDFIDDATRFSYLLGYSPSVRLQNGGYRRIDVRVTRPGVTVLFRHGYYAREEPTPLNRQRMITYSRVVSAMNFASDVPDIRVAATATPPVDPTATAVTVKIAIDLSRVHFEKMPDGRNKAAIELAIFGIRDRGQHLVGQWWRTLELTYTNERLQQMTGDGFRHEVVLPTLPLAQDVKVVVYDFAADLVGSMNAKVRRP